jgi:hypothetical protein
MISLSHIFLVGLFVCYAASTTGQSIPGDIAHIKEVYLNINSHGHLKKVTMDDEEFLDQSTDGGAALTGYFAKDSLLKITSWIGLSYGIQQIDFYFENSNLLFCLVTELHFKHTASDLDYSKTEKALENRYYYKREALILKKTAGSGFWNKNDEKEIIPDSKNYFEMLSKKNKKTRS